MRFQRDNRKREEIEEGLYDYESRYECHWDDYEDWSDFFADGNWDWYVNQHADIPMIEQLELPFVYSGNTNQHSRDSGRSHNSQTQSFVETWRNTSRLGRIRFSERVSGDTLAKGPAHRTA